jgi:hypothetical protein
VVGAKRGLVRAVWS